MLRKQGLLRTIALALLLVCVTPLAAPTQDAKTAAPRVASIEQRVDAFLARLEARRKEQGVIGASVVIVQGDRVVRSTGLGVRSLNSDEPITDETVFALASVTKHFTAMAVAMLVSDGKMSFEDHPRRFVPSFRLQDPEADANLNMIDLLAHRSGLDRSDLTWLLAPFTQDELFELAFRSTPAAKLRERFMYNNAMYALAGAAVAGAGQTSYQHFMTERLFKPLGMSSTTVTFAGLTKSPNRAVGFGFNPKAGVRPLRPVNLESIAGAGAINSTARDMGLWLKFLHSGGRIDETNRIEPKAFARVFESHAQVSADTSYGLGFFLRNRSGVLVAEHGGNVPGYTSQVVHVPDRALSFALLTNQNSSRLGAMARELFWEVVVRPEIAATSKSSAPKQTPKPAPKKSQAAVAIESERLIGRFFSSQGAEFEVRPSGSDLVAVFARQPPYPLKQTQTNRFDLSGLKGFSVAFAESQAMPGRIVALLRQPPPMPPNMQFLKRDDVWLARAGEQYHGSDKELIGVYRASNQTMMMEIIPIRGGLALVITGQRPHVLQSVSADQYRLEGLPFEAQLQFKRTGGGRIVGFTLTQPNVRLEMMAVTTPAGGDSEEARGILDKAVAAIGGEEALNSLSSIRAYGRTSAPTHGLEGRAESHIAPGSRVDIIELGAFGKTVLRVNGATNDRWARLVARDGTQTELTGRSLHSMRFFAVPHILYRWKERYATVAMAGEASINGEDAFVIELTPKELAPVRIYISTKSFLPLRQDTPVYVGDELQPASRGTDFSDHRLVDGVRMPFAVATDLPGFGRVAMTYERILFNDAIDPKFFDELPK